MKLIFLFSICLLFVTSCGQAPKKSSHEKQRPDTRHGWTIFSGPRPTTSKESHQASIERGQKIYHQHCFKCHGSKGLGDGPKAKLLQITPANLTNLSKVQNRHSLVFQINKGRGNMPQWKDLLTARETWDLSSFVLSLQKKQ